MSECVVRMELRDNCLDCDLHQTMYGDTRDDTEVFCVKERRYIGKRFGPTKDLARPDWCPILAVLPDKHGRLVDMRDIDSMMENIQTTSDESGLYGLYYRDDFDFDGLPTIVPETEGGKE